MTNNVNKIKIKDGFSSQRVHSIRQWRRARIAQISNGPAVLRPLTKSCSALRGRSAFRATRWVVDGGSEGTQSRNGATVNGTFCFWELHKRHLILGSYQHVGDTQLQSYFQVLRWRTQLCGKLPTHYMQSYFLSFSL